MSDAGITRGARRRGKVTSTPDAVAATERCAALRPSDLTSASLSRVTMMRDDARHGDITINWTTAAVRNVFAANWPNWCAASIASENTSTLSTDHLNSRRIAKFG